MNSGTPASDTLDICVSISRPPLNRVSGSGCTQSLPLLNLDTQLPAEGVTAIYGPSGSGKTTLLRCIAGLTQAPNARVIFKDQVWQSGSSFLPTHKRPIGYVFQESNLFNHLSAKENLTFALKRTKKPTITFDSVVDLLGLGSLLNHYPNQLSGGEKQRVAIARALLIGPELLLMDEPLASLDSELKKDILPYLEELRNELNIPILYVSHSLEEIARLADNVAVLQRGELALRGALNDVLTDLGGPLSLGDDACVVLETTKTEQDSRWHLMKLNLGAGDLWVADNGTKTPLNTKLRVRIHARDVSLALSSQNDNSILNKLSATVIEIADIHQSAMATVKLKVGEHTLLARVTRKSAQAMNLTSGTTLWAQVKSVAIVD